MKKLVCMLLTIALLLSVTACGNTPSDSLSKGEDTDTTVNTDEIQEISLKEGLLFTTEYDVEDYVENAIIVSKNDGLLYGVLDQNGNEVIPVKYDDMVFMNKDEYLDGKIESIYLWALYEDTETIFDVSGNEIIETTRPLEYTRSDALLNYIRYTMDVTLSDSVPLFSEKLEDYSRNLYNQTGQKLCTTIPLSSSWNGVVYINEKYYVAYVVNESVIISNYEGSIIESFEGSDLHGFPFAYGQECFLAINDGDRITSFRLDDEGNFLKTEEFENATDYSKYTNSLSEQYDTEKVRSYHYYGSNSTLKMEDLDGNPLYAERYYDNLSVDGENDCYFLTDENDSVCVFGRQGDLYIEFGVLTGTGANSIYLTSESGNKDIEEVHEGKESIVLVVSTAEGSEIYFYN